MWAIMAVKGANKGLYLALPEYGFAYTVVLRCMQIFSNKVDAQGACHWGNEVAVNIDNEPSILR